MLMQEWGLYDRDGKRKYLTPEERLQFLEAIPEALGRSRRTFALMLYYTGCRISEALNVTHERIDYSRQGVVFQTLKRRKKTFRFVPLPDHFLEKLDDVHHVKDEQKGSGKKSPLWSFNRVTAWAAVKAAMAAAGIEGAQANPKGLRHSFAIFHQGAGTPEHMIQRWLGWASPAMLSVYGNAVGQEELALASKLWET